MSSKMLIDASHPEETRVVVTKGNKIEDFDFESEHKKQIRGNIYLAKVTRVEPSLQACFVEYGGNRHGFLPFSEIHPDYYQIPVADREALMREMAVELAAEDGDDEGAEIAAREDGDEGERGDGGRDGAKDGKTRRRSRRGGRRRRGETRADDAADGDDDGDDDATDTDEGGEPDAFADDDDPDAIAAAVEGEEVSEEPGGGADDEPAPAEKPKRRTSRRKAPVAETAGDAPAAVETVDADVTEAVDAEPAEEAPKPKRRAPRRKKAPVAETSETPAEAAGDAATAEAPSGESVSETVSAQTAEDALKSEEAPKPKRRASRRKKAPVESASVKEASDGASTEAADETLAGAKVADQVVDAVADALSLNEAEGGDVAADETPSEDGADDKPARAKRSRRRKTPEKASAKAAEGSDDADETEATRRARAAPADPDDADDAPEETGADDALDEAEDEVAPRRQRVPRKHYKIQEVIKRRQILLVQVNKEERGNKGAALTTYLSLAGRYSVLMPNTARGGGISRKIAQASDRKRLKEIARGLDVPDGMGVILRTAAAARTKPEVNRDFEYLMRLWDSVRELTLQSSAPALVYEEGDLIKRSIRDLYNKDISEIVVAGEEGYREARDFMRMLMPSQERDVKKWVKATPMLAAHGVEAELDRMMQPQVNLKSGGYIIIDQTEALVAIDVNSGRSTREHSIEQTARNTNLEAAEEVARQLKLRDLAGLIVIDFIDMDEKRNNRAVESRLKDCLKHDRARIQLGRISSFGLLEMSRQRMRSSVLESTMQECPHCHGTGHLKSESSVGLAMLRAVEEQMRKQPDHAVVVRTDAATALSVLNTKRAHVTALEEEHGVPVVLEADGTLPHQTFKVERGAFVERTQRIERQVRQDHTLMDVVDAGSEDDDGEDTTETVEARAAGSDAPREPEAKREVEAKDEGEARREPDGDEDGDGKRRRRGRRGGRRRNEDGGGRGDGSAEADDPASPGAIVAEAVEDGPAEGVVNAEPATAEPVAATASEDGAEVTTRPRRRRSTRRAAPMDDSLPNGRAPDTSVADVSTPDAPASDASRDDRSTSTGDGDGQEAKGGAKAEEAPARRSTRRRKAPLATAVTAEVTATPSGSAETDAGTPDDPEPSSGPDMSDGDAAPRRGTRRSTRRAPAPIVAAQDTMPASTDEAGSEALAAPATDGAAPSAPSAPGDEGPDAVVPSGTTGSGTEAAAEETTDDEGDAKPRRGWWNRGFF